jgi:hypothetical protein
LPPTGSERRDPPVSFLLVSGKGPAGEPEGVAPDMAREIGQRLSVAVVDVLQ